ncbi:MAG: hypothetical protein RL204_487 [Bacteroidota bacterium]|jgi:hypothetical protein
MDRHEQLGAILSDKKNAITIQDGRFYTETNLVAIKAELDKLNIAYHAETSFLWIENKQSNNLYVIPFENLLSIDYEMFITHEVWAFELSGDWAATSGGATVNNNSLNLASGQLLLFQNCKAYARLLTHLLKKSNPEDLLFEGNYNSAEGVLVLHSSTNGVFKITHSTATPSFTKPISDSVAMLIKYSSEHYKTYFINSLFSFRENSLRLTIPELIDSARALTDLTRRNYELVQKQFDFAKFKDALLVEKEKYFNAIREVAGKVFSQVIGIPISLTGAIYAAYKFGTDVWAAAIIIFAFAIYTTFYLVLQSGNRRDLIELRHDFRRNFVMIRSKSGLSKAVVDREYQTVMNRIARYLRVIFALKVSVIVLLILAIVYVGLQFPNNASNSQDANPSKRDSISNSGSLKSDSTETPSNSLLLGKSIDSVPDSTTTQHDLTR